MEGFLLAKTDNTPLVEGGSGFFKMDGVALPENPREYFKPVFNWINAYNQSEILIDINLYYFNTAVSKLLMEMFKAFEANEHIENINVNWHYEEDDLDMLDSGEIYEGELERSEFDYISYAEAV